MKLEHLALSNILFISKINVFLKVPHLLAIGYKYCSYCNGGRRGI